jgi:hypothetical protein
MKRRILFTLIACSWLSVTPGKAQQIPPVKTKTAVLDDSIGRRAADTLARQSFAKMVAGTEDITSIANYVTFVPTDGKFTLAGNYFFRTKNKDSTGHKRPYEYFAVGFTGAGSVVGGNVATLFDQSKLATGTDLGLRFSWRLNRPNVGSIASETQVMEDKRTALIIDRDAKLSAARNDIALLPDQVQQKKWSIADTRSKLNKMVSDTMAIRNDIKAATSIADKRKAIDSLVAVKGKIFDAQQKIIILKNDSTMLQELYDVASIKKGMLYGQLPYRLDSLRLKYGMNPKVSYEDTIARKIIKAYDDKIFQVEIARPIQGIRLNWLSLIGNWNRRSYRTYTSTIPFDVAIVKNNFDGFTAGLQMNLYTFYKPVQKANLFNFALLIKKTNDLDDLTASKVNDETTVVNGSTTRKANTEYTVYTDPVDVYTTWQLPVNYYHFYGKDLNFGCHFFGAADWRNNGKSVYDLGAGYILGLNTAGSKRLFNIEMFITYKDLKRDLIKDKTDSKWKQLQVGLSVAIPFMIYKN